MPDPQSFDPRFAPVLRDARLEKLCTGALWSEGPVWMHEDDSLLWSDIPNNRMLRWSEADGLSVWREAVEYTNGHTRDLNGDLLHCSHGLRAVVRTPATQRGVAASAPDRIVVDRFEGKRLNSPNDIVVRSDGTLWFTDPPYGILSDEEGHAAPQEQAANHIFCWDPATEVLTAASADMIDPNGLAFSPDETMLYASDTSFGRLGAQGRRHIVAFDVDGHSLRNMRVVKTIEPGLPDGFRVDRHGWIYTSALDGVHVVHPDGTDLGLIPVPEKVGNLTFGGPGRDVLYIAASRSLYRIRLHTKGLQQP